MHADIQSEIYTYILPYMQTRTHTHTVTVKVTPLGLGCGLQPCSGGCPGIGPKHLTTVQTFDHGPNI